MKKIILLYIIFISAGNCFGQQITFQKTYGGIYGDGGNSIQQTTDGGYIIVGSYTSMGVGNVDVYLIKADVSGDTLWTKTYGGSGIDFANSVQQTVDGGYVIIGTTTSFGAGYNDVYLIKTDNNGNFLWTKTFGGTLSEMGNSVQQTTDGGYIIGARTNSFGGLDDNAYLIKTDSSGNLLWTKTYGGTDQDEALCVRQTQDGGYIITGYTWSYGVGTINTYLIKTDSNGNLLWVKTFGGVYTDVGYWILQTTDAGYVIAGYTSSGAAGSDVCLIKTDSIGNLLWAKAYGGPNTDDGFSVQQTPDGGFIIGGITNSFGAGNDDIYLIKTDSIGNLIWTKTSGGTSFDRGSTVQQTTDGGYVICGVTDNFGAGNTDVYLIKTDSLGNSRCNEGNPATIVTTPATQVTSPATIVFSPPTIVTTPAAIVGSGGTVTTLCTSVGINPISKVQFPISISPNPTTNNFTITFPNTINKCSIEIYNVMGKKIYKENIAEVSQKEIRFKNTVAGIYFVKIKDGEKEFSQKLLVK